MHTLSTRTWVVLTPVLVLVALLGAGHFFMTSQPTPVPGSAPLLVAVQGADVATAGLEDPGLRKTLLNLSLSNSRVLLQVGGAASQEKDLTPMYGKEPDTDQVRRAQTSAAMADGLLAELAGIDRFGGEQRTWLATLDAAARAARAAGISRVIMVVNPLATAAPLAMQDGLWPLTSDDVVDKLDKKGYLPDTHGLDLQIHLLDPATDGPQQPLEPPIRIWLEDVVSAVAAAGGATTETRWLPGAASTSNTPATLVPIPQPTAIHGSACEIGAINFRSNTDTPVDRAALRRGVARCAEALAAATKIAVEGYASADGSGDGVDLSTRRAQLVASYLVAAGIDPALLTIHGYGSTGPVPHPPASNPRNRVVIVRGTTHD